MEKIIEYEGDQLVIPQLAPPVCVDIFCGVGGFSASAALCNCQVLAAVELEPTNALYHDLNFPKGKTFLADVGHISARDIRNGSDIQNNEIDICLISPPCTAFSMAGKRDMADPRAKLLKEACRLIVELQPKYFVLENVKGLTQGKQKRFLLEAIAYLKERGYSVTEDYSLLNARDFGVPQSRSRLFLFGARRNLLLPSYPIPADSPHPTVRDAIADLPKIENYPELLERSFTEAKFGKPSKYAISLGATSANTRTLTYSKRTIHSEAVLKRFKQTPPNKTEPVSRFFRLDWSGVSNTLRAGAGTYTAIRPIHPNGRRVITVKEAARLSSFPDDFIFADNTLRGLRQIGNSVPPYLGRAVIAEVVKALKGS